MNIFASVLAVASFTAYGAEIVLPSNALERDGTVNAIYRTNPLATGKGTLSIEWSDSYGRVVLSRKIAVDLRDENQIAFPLPVYRARAMKNTVKVHLSFEGVNKKQEPDRREEDAQVDFIAKPPDRRWWDYEIMMWQHRTAAQFGALKHAGINAGEFVGSGKNLPDFLLDNNLRWYLENIATDFYSEYHRYFPDRPNNWRFTEVREQHQQNPASREPFKRHPSLSDPVWLKKVHDRLVERARFYSAYRPIFYNLGDESGIANLAAYWDFDFSDQSLEAMREWLRERYGTLQALNAQWGARFPSWNAVIPDTTDEAMKRQDDNFSSWGDFKEWMDIAYARALKMGTDAVHSVDRDAYVAIEGAQMPGWGGYDYSRIAGAVNAIEPYDIGNNIEILRSLNPAMAVVTTSFQSGPWEQHRVWYELLHGNRGLILWDDKSAFIGPNNELGARAKEVGPYYNELRGGIGAQLIASERDSSMIAIHYSQPSMRTEWMLAQRPKGAAWAERTSSTERKDSDFLRLRESYCRLIEDEGLQYNFVSYGQVEDGELVKRPYKVLILPRSSSLSASEAESIHDFTARGGTLIADGRPGVFDEHGRRLAKGQLDELFDISDAGPYTTHSYGAGKAIYLNRAVLDYHQLRLVRKETAIHEMFAGILRQAGVRPEIAVTDSAGKPPVGVEVHTFHNGGVTILALMSNPDLRVDELGPPNFRSNERFAKPAPVHVALPFDAYVYDMRARAALGRKRDIDITVQPYEPVILSICPAALPRIRVTAAARAARGTDLRITIASEGSSVASRHAMHVDIIDPSGNAVEYYSGNLIASRGNAGRLVPLAMNDPAGRWTIKVHDLLSGQEVSGSFEVY